MPDPIGFVTAAPLDKTQLETRIRSRKNGAVVTFEGIVRDHDHGEDVGSLDYEAHPDAERILIDVCTRIAQTTDCDVVAAHRIGHLEIGDVALVTVVAAPHRAGRSPSAGTSSTRSRQRFRSGSTSTSPTADRSGWGCRYTARPSEPAG